MTAGKERDCVSPLYFYFLQHNMHCMQPVLGRGKGCVGGGGGVSQKVSALTSFPELFVSLTRVQ